MYITSIYQLGELLTNNVLYGDRLSNLYRFIEEYNGDDWKNHLHRNNGNDLHKIRVYSNHFLEIYLICWNENMETDIHNYPTNGTLIKVLEGILLEDIYKLDEKDEFERIESSYLQVGEFSDINKNQNVVYRSISRPTYSLHIYSKEDSFPNVKSTSMEKYLDEIYD